MKWLPWAKYWYNTSFHSAIRMTPFKVLYGRDPPHLLHYDHGTAATFEVDRYLRERDVILDELKGHLLRSQQLMKTQADGKRRGIEFGVGDFVFLKLRPHRQVTALKRANEKLAPRYYGPFEVLERIGKVAYKLQLPPTAAIHPVFHVSQLKRSIGNHMTAPDLPSADLSTAAGPFQPAHVRGTREMGGQREVSFSGTD